jgi:hypothetical protein
MWPPVRYDPRTKPFSPRSGALGLTLAHRRVRLMTFGAR